MKNTNPSKLNKIPGRSIVNDKATPPEIPIDEAAEWTANWRAMFIAKPQAQAFTANEIQAVLNVVDSNGNPAEGVRVYYGVKEKEGEIGKAKEYIFKLFLVATDADGTDIMPPSGKIMDFARPCPSYCGEANILNSGLTGIDEA